MAALHEAFQFSTKTYRWENAHGEHLISLPRIRSKRKSMKYVTVITGTSSGLGALTARALVKAGHIVYASMRDTTARNAPQVEEARKFAEDNNIDLRTAVPKFFET
jgi:hypothetical protein